MSGVRLSQAVPPADLFVQRVEVRFDYPVYFTRKALAPQNRVLCDALSRREPDRRHRALCAIDDGLLAAQPDLIDELRAYQQAHQERFELIDVLTVPGGERAKSSPELIERMHTALHRHGVDRQSYVIGIGGGAVLDAVGYAAATAHRGVRLLRVPSTVLGQNDAGVGVKNGINAFGAKNFLGTFAPPFAVINDFDLLRTLPARDVRAGLAEAVKVALIRNHELFEWLEAHADALRECEPAAVEQSVRVAAEIHLRHIATAGDPFELGSARPLDFGHWSAHKLESLTGHALRHGEAVAIGMALDCRYAVLAGLLAEADQLRVHNLLERLGFRLYDEALGRLDASETPAVIAGLREFQEHLGGELTVTLLTGVGQCLEVHALDHELIAGALTWLEQRDRARVADAEVASALGDR